MTKPIVDGIPGKTNVQVEVIHLNLLVGVGREAASQYGVRMVPATLLLDNRGRLLERQIGRLDADMFVEKMEASPFPDNYTVN